jgi:hypothetical protein
MPLLHTRLLLLHPILARLSKHHHSRGHRQDVQPPKPRHDHDCHDHDHDHASDATSLPRNCSPLRLKHHHSKGLRHIRRGHRHIDKMSSRATTTTTHDNNNDNDHTRQRPRSHTTTTTITHDHDHDHDHASRWTVHELKTCRQWCNGMKHLYTVYSTSIVYSVFNIVCL